jgi:hypothetical protein
VSTRSKPPGDHTASSWEALLEEIDPDSVPEYARDILHSRAVADAFRGADLSADELRETVLRLNAVLFFARGVLLYGEEPADLGARLELMRSKHREAVASLRHAASLLSDPYSRDVLAIARMVSADRWTVADRFIEAAADAFDPGRRGKRGRAAASREGAMVGWTVRELDQLLPRTSANRYAAIAALLQGAEIQRTPVQVRSVLTRGKA